MQWSKTTVFLVLLSFFPTTASAQKSPIAQVTIDTHWLGLSQVSNTKVLIVRDGNGYRRGQDRIESQLVESLLTALNEPSIPEPELQNLGINQAWLDANAIPAVEKYARYAVSFDDAAPNQKALYKTSFTSQTLIEQVVPNVLNVSRSDDYPSVKVEVTFDGGSKATVDSDSQGLFMLPWKVKRNGEAFDTYNANISRAVAALMPNNATNRARIAGERLDVDLADAVMHYIEKDWNLLNAENRVGSTLAALRTKYTVESADINPYHDVAFGAMQIAIPPLEENLHVVVRQKSFPESFSENAILLYSDGKVFGTEDFLQNAGKYEQLVLSVPWFNTLLTKYPGFRIQLLWVHDRSFSEKAMKQFAADMGLIGKDALVDEVRSEQDKIALITVNYGDYWLVLPDKRMVLWRFSTVYGLLNFEKSDFSVHKCLNYGTGTGGCVGAVILPDGTLKR